MRFFLAWLLPSMEASGPGGSLQFVGFDGVQAAFGGEAGGEHVLMVAPALPGVLVIAACGGA
ncbi:hypothetical protein [Kineococcus sp. SYSU DK005]|uniref:hypothetical protein n=1 Tax=Kineococcus sp. SYSU DK005 TaxID=3383126 RepID=UPI003D7C3C26